MVSKRLNTVASVSVKPEIALWILMELMGPLLQSKSYLLGTTSMSALHVTDPLENT